MNRNPNRSIVNHSRALRLRLQYHHWRCSAGSREHYPRIQKYFSLCDRCASVVNLFFAALKKLGFPGDDEPAVNPPDKMAAVTSGSHNLQHRSICNL